jgi:hypothetical protein
VGPRTALRDWRIGILEPTGNQTPDWPSRSAVGIPIALSRLRLKTVALLVRPVLVGLVHMYRTVLGTKYNNSKHLQSHFFNQTD